MIKPLLALTIILSCLAENLSAQSWELRKDEDGIRVYTMPVEGSSLDAFKAETMMNAKLDRLVTVLQEVSEFPNWMPDCTEAELYEIDGDKQYHYTLTDAPFPVSDRDAIAVFEYTKEGDNVKVLVKGLPDYKPAKEDIVRIPELDGYWLLEPAESGKTRVTYQLHASPGGSVPAWLANATAVDSPYETLKNLRARVE